MGFFLLFFATLLFGYFNFQVTATCNLIHPDAGLSTEALITKHNYPVETRLITTEDGYILTTHRIPHGRNETPNPNQPKPVVLILHGIVLSSHIWVMMGPEISLGFLLADAGFDVWLGNQRGNLYSRSHTSLNPDLQATQFFDFSFHEMGVYDNPAMIDYIKTVTGQPKLIYIGYSQGGAAYLVMTSERPQYLSSIQGVILLAPAVYLKHSAAPLTVGFQSGSIPFEAASLLMPEFIRHNQLASQALMQFCSTCTMNEICLAVLSSLTGFNYDQLEQTTPSILLTAAPAGTSSKDVKHYVQATKVNSLPKYDYGLVRNLLTYGWATPPSYVISRNTAPTIMYYGKNDWLVVPEDIVRLSKDLPNLIDLRPVTNLNWTHGDFIYAKDLRTLLNQHIVDDCTAFGL